MIQFVPLLRTLVLAAKQDPLTPFKIVPHVGLFAILDFLYHMTALGFYTFLSAFVAPIVVDSIVPVLSDPAMIFRVRRQVEAWKFGSGLDYYDHE